MPSNTYELTPADIAKRDGCSWWTAWRYLRKLEKTHGPIVKRKGRTLVIDAAELARVEANIVDGILEPRVKHLEGVVDVQARQISALRKDVEEFRRKSAEWFAQAPTRPPR